MSIFKKNKPAAKGLVNTIDFLKKNVSKVAKRKESSFSVPILITVGIIIACGLIMKQIADSQTRVDY